MIREELRLHDPRLLEKPLIVVFNKMDLETAREAWPAFEVARRAEGLAVIAVSAESGTGLERLRAAVGELLPAADDPLDIPEPFGVVVHRLDAAGDGFTLEREGDAHRVRGKRIERIAAQTNFDVEESAERFQRALDRQGIDAALRKAGITPGDLVRIGAIEFEWGPDAWESGAE